MTPPHSLPAFTKASWFLVLSNIVLAILIYLNAEAGRLIGIPGQALSISVVWPPTGFALAALLILGIFMWPGILAGNFIYNFIHLNVPEQPLIAVLLTSGVISLGSLVEALAGFYIMSKYCSRGYFNTVRDVLIFLVPVGLLTSFAASTIGVTALALFSTMTWDTAFNMWSSFWIGDTMGMYVFTPLIVVWTLLKPTVFIRQCPWQALAMLGAFVAITISTFVYQYPVAHLFIPLSIWVPYRLRMHGATLAIFLMTLAFIIPTSFGSGPFQPEVLTNPLGVLVSFMEVIVATSLIVAALVNEREAAWRQIQNHNISLQQAVDMGQEELKEKNSEIFYQEKRASLGLLTLGIARQMHVPIERISTLARASVEALGGISGLFQRIREKLDPDMSLAFEQNLEQLSNHLANILTLEVEAREIAQAIEEHSHLTNKGGLRIKSININTLLNRCLDAVITELSKSDPGFTFITKEEFDRNVTMILAVPEDLGRAFLHLMMNSMRSMKEKKERQGPSYNPVLKISTVEMHNRIEIVIHDNGQGIPENQVPNYFFSLVEHLPKETSQRPMMEPHRLRLSLAYDIISCIYKGSVEVDSKEGEYLEVTITIPKDKRF